MSNYYDSLGQDLAPLMGMPPLDQGGPPPGQPPMPPPQQPLVQGPPDPNAFRDDPFNKAIGQGAMVAGMMPGKGGPMPGGGQPPMPPPGPPPPGPPPQGPQQGGGGPPMPPPMPGQEPSMTAGAGGASVPFGPSTDWAGATGLTPTDGDRMTSALGGFGKGMTAAAGSKNSAGASFMRGAGGAITGQINEAQEQQKLKLGLRNEYFNQTSAAFKNAMAQKSTDAKDLYWQSRAQQYLALAKAGVKTPWNSDQLALARAEDEARKNYASDRADLNDQIKGDLITTEQGQKQFAALQAKKGQYYTDAYKKYGVDPDKAENMRTQGMRIEKPFSDVKTGDWYIDQTGKAIKKTANDNSYAPGDTVKWINPFDTSKMSVTGFHQDVPQGAYYTTPAGLHQRTIPPPMRPDPQQLQQSIQGAEQEENYTGGPQ